MARRLPNHPQTLNQCRNLSDAVNWYLDEKNMTQAQLAERSGLLKAVISRICRNSNDKGATYQPTLPVVMAVSIGFSLSPMQGEELCMIAFPEMRLWRGFLEKGLNIGDANTILYDEGLPLLGSAKEE